ncbi:hypothetical protein EJ02DRAFT_516036 [Clathrospora elynae]|uniref:Uncharacterized protein n=1 Tax=Clathrospora elynae TaxID=706981 RepID=A0A6A5S7R4_9PLEO|nr:hypothetical protein EJ02DRAFT_516036 [Clathrospora elynae]
MANWEKTSLVYNSSTVATTLWISNTPVVTLDVLPSNAGLGLPNQTALTPGGSPATLDNIRISVQASPPEIFFQRVEATSHSSSITPSPSGQVTSAPASSATASATPKPTNTGAGLPAGAIAGTVIGSLAAGAIAGIAIGSLAAGALIASLIFWLCCGKRRRSHRLDPEASALPLGSHEKKPASKVVPLESEILVGAATDGAFPQPVEDRVISGDISKISNSIKNHVQSYYHGSRISPGLIDHDDIQALGHSLPISVGTLSTLLGNAATREIALRFVIAWVVVSRMHPSGEPSRSLLPPEVAHCYQGITAADPSSPANVSMMLYADSRMNNEERKQNLEELLKRSASFAFTLFSQPSSWEFEWQEEQGITSGELCIYPALVQVADETGQAISPPRPFSEAVVRRLDA